MANLVVVCTHFSIGFGMRSLHGLGGDVDVLIGVIVVRSRASISS